MVAMVFSLFILLIIFLEVVRQLSTIFFGQVACKNTKMHSYTTAALAVLILSPIVSAWGVVGHATVATIAHNYLTPAGKTYVASILGEGVTIPSISSWADNYRETTAGRFSAPYQYAPFAPSCAFGHRLIHPLTASSTQKTPRQAPAVSTSLATAKPKAASLAPSPTTRPAYKTPPSLPKTGKKPWNSSYIS